MMEKEELICFLKSIEESSEFSPMTKKQIFSKLLLSFKLPFHFLRQLDNISNNFDMVVSKIYGSH